MQPNYMIERYTNVWTIKTSNANTPVPAHAFTEIQPFLKKDEVSNSDLAKTLDATFAFAKKDASPESKGNLLYSLERHNHGWLVKIPENQNGIAIDDMLEFTQSMPHNTKVQCGIASALNAMMALATTEEGQKWTKEIEDNIKNEPKEDRWIKGTDTGTSSATLFKTLATRGVEQAIKKYKSDATPSDADDFGRCYRLIQLFPEWEPRLPEVAQRFPNTNWPQIIENWKNLCTLHEQKKWRELSQKLHSFTKNKK